MSTVLSSLCISVTNMFVRLSLCFYLFIIGSKARPPNFVLILTDDQDILLNGMLPMKQTIKWVANKGKTFKNAYVNTPICCPSRSSILTGKYPHNTGVVNNSISGNCSSLYWQENHEPQTIAMLLKQQANYVNFYAGKYLNEYGMKQVGGIQHVPPGYDWWLGLKGNSRYYNYTLSVNGTKKYFPDEYLTDVMNDYALDFLNQKHRKQKPFFMTLATPACHAPFTPADRHKQFYLNETAVRSPSFNYTPTDKHWVVKMKPDHLPDDVTYLDNIQKSRLQTLLAVDDMVGNIIAKLKDMKVLKNTYIIFTSDNGFHIGQFTQPWDKRQPYQTDIRVPFVIRGPKIPKKSMTNYPLAAVDILPTILDLANVTLPSNLNVDGKSVKKILLKNNTKEPFNAEIFIEYTGSGSPKTLSQDCIEKLGDDMNLAECVTENWCKCQDSRNNTYTCVITFSHEKIKYCKFDDKSNFTEVYDLLKDPYELINISDDMDATLHKKYSNVLNKFKSCSGVSCKNIF